MSAYRDLSRPFASCFLWNFDSLGQKAFIPSAPGSAFKTCMISLMLVPKFCVKVEACMVDLSVGPKVLGNTYDGQIFQNLFD